MILLKDIYINNKMEKSQAGGDVYQATNISYEETKDGHIEYIVTINAPGGYIFQFRDRYSNMRAFQKTLKKSFDDAVFNQGPNFPPKKTFGTKKDSFLKTRSS